VVNGSTIVTTTSLGVQEPPSSLRRDWLWGLILILSVILTYSPVWHAGFIWDDDAILTANPCVVGPLGLKEIWTTPAADICPLVLTTLWAEHALWGLAPLPYHVVNVLLHGTCALLLWRVLRSLRVQGAWLGAALWGVHPVEVESVAWITETKNTESGLFFLLSILFFVRWLRVKDLDRRTRGHWNYALTLLFAVLAMASKSSTVILALVLCLCAWWMDGRRWHWRNVASVVPIFLMAVASSALTIWTQGLHLATVTDQHWVRTWPQRLVTAGDAVWFYFGKLLWPHPLITIYPRWQIDGGRWVSYLPTLAVVVILSVLWLKRQLWSGACFFAIAYFVMALLPALGMIDNYIFRYSLVFDHFQYLASIGPLALAGTALARFSDFIIPNKPWLQSSLCAGLLLILGMASWQRALVYESEGTVWTDTLANNPKAWVGRNNLGVVFTQRGQIEKALEQFQEGLRINANYELTHYNLGLALVQSGQLTGAMDQFQKALEINPNYAEAHNDLGLALLQKGQLGEAMDQFQKALGINPNFAEAHNNLGLALLQRGQLDEATEQFRKALESKPDFAEAHQNLGVAFSQKGQLDEAINQFQKALEVNPNLFEAHQNLGAAFGQKGQLDSAITQFEEVLRLKPDYRPAKDNLDQAYALVRQRDGHKSDAGISRSCDTSRSGH
jgi:Flp pilus assembly protein TadD